MLIRSVFLSWTVREVPPTVALVLSFTASLSATAPVFGADQGGFSAGEFARYRNQQTLELEWEQAARAPSRATQSPEDARSQRRGLEAERRHQRQLLELQRKKVQVERVKRRPMPRPEVSRVITLQRLGRAQASERLSRKLLR